MKTTKTYGLLGALAGVGALLALAAASSALAVSVPRANGNDYLVPNGNVYQETAAGFRLIPDVPTANAMGLAWNRLHVVSGVSPIATPIASVVAKPAPAPLKMRPPAVMANGQDYLLPNGNVYQLGADGRYHLIPDLPTANAMGVEWTKLHVVSRVGTIGKPLPSVFFRPQPATCTKTTKPTKPANGKDYLLPSGDVYQLGTDGRFHLIPDLETAHAMGLNWNKLHLVGHVTPIGAPLASVCA